jgi:hypothetical protein
MHDPVGAASAFRPTGILAGIAFLFAPAMAAPQILTDSMLTAATAPSAACRENPSLPLDSFTALHAAAAAAPAPAGQEPASEPWPTNVYQNPWSRIAVGADVSPLGIGIKGATILNTFMDLRLDTDFFHYDTGRFEIEGVNVDGQLHLASATAKVDMYPWLSVWRVSAGLMFFNANRLDAGARIAGGTSFTLDHRTFYSASQNAVTGATPVTGSGTFGLHRHQPAFELSGGFGKFIPRSQRHWSFPVELGVVFMGAPTVQVNLTGSVCQDKAQTRCGNLSDTANPVTADFNNALQASLTKWRQQVSSFSLYPVFSYSVVYSFNTGR